MKQQKLPSGFRYLFTKKEIKELEREIGLKFFDVTFGHVTNSQRLNSETIPITLHTVSLYGKEEIEGWTFSLRQSGFREELLPQALESEVKSSVAVEIKRYMDKAAKFIDTDFIQRPQLWIYCLIYQERAEIKSRELK